MVHFLFCSKAIFLIFQCFISQIAAVSMLASVKYQLCCLLVLIMIFLLSTLWLLYLFFFSLASFCIVILAFITIHVATIVVWIPDLDFLGWRLQGCWAEELSQVPKSFFFHALFFYFACGVDIPKLLEGWWFSIQVFLWKTNLNFDIILYAIKEICSHIFYSMLILWCIFRITLTYQK